MAIKEYWAYGKTKTHTDSNNYTRSWRPYVKYTVDEATTAVTFDIAKYGIQAQHSGTMSFSANYITSTLTYDGETVETYKNAKSVSLKGMDTCYSFKSASSALSRIISKLPSSHKLSVTFEIKVLKGAWKDTSAVTFDVEIPALSEPVVSFNFYRNSSANTSAMAVFTFKNVLVGATVYTNVQMDVPQEILQAHPDAVFDFGNSGAGSVVNEFNNGSRNVAGRLMWDGAVQEMPKAVDFNGVASFKVVQKGGTYEYEFAFSSPATVSAKEINATVSVDSTTPPIRKTDGTTDAVVEAFNFISGEWDVLDGNVKVDYRTAANGDIVGYTIKTNLEAKYLADPTLAETTARLKVSYNTKKTLQNDDHQAFFSTTRNCGFTNGLANVMFVGGSESPKYGSRVWYSYFNDPLYFPDDNFIEVGSNDTNVMGLVKIGEYLGIIKQGKTTDSSIYIAYPASFEENSTYAVKPSASGIGAISKYAFNILGNESLFLSKEGVMAISFNEEDVDKQVKNRSYYVDGKLLNEPVDKLSKAYSFVWNGYYLLAVENEEDNGHVYVLDGNQRNSWGNDRTNLVYECYFWDNVPAKCFVKFNNELWFSDGKRMCRFKAANEDRPYNDEGKAIFAEWSTIFDDDGSSHYTKDLQKKGSKLTLSPSKQGTSCDVYFKTDNGVEQLIGLANSDATDIPIDFFFNKKLKKYKRLQIIVRNEVPDQSFGISQIVKLYTIGNYSK